VTPKALRSARSRRFAVSCAAFLASAVLLGACVAGAPATPARGIIVNGPPPAALPETRPAPPSPLAAWVAGYWHWNGATYAWIPGHWENAPPGMIWYAPSYGATADGHYLYEPGRFRPGAPAAPAGPATANALR
jgi:hypothetical protein